MKYFFVISLLALVAYIGITNKSIPLKTGNPFNSETARGGKISVGVKHRNAALRDAFRLKKSGLRLTGYGKVIKVLSDDTKGIRHQRFIVRTSPAQTILVAHNIEIAPRIPNLAVGDAVEFRGEYKWNRKGGIVHWTHHDPRRRHPGGWIKYRGIKYR